MQSRTAPGKKGSVQPISGCQEIGLAAWLDAQDPDNRQQVSVGTATVAMILNGLGESLRQLYLVPQFFAGHPSRTLARTRDQRREARVLIVWVAR